MTDKRYTKDEIWAAFMDELRSWSMVPAVVVAVGNGLMSRLTKSKLRDDCPVMVDGVRVKNCVIKADGIDHFDTNIRALIPVPEAREIARRAITRQMSTEGQVAASMAEVDRDLSAYQYGKEGV